MTKHYQNVVLTMVVCCFTMLVSISAHASSDTDGISRDRGHLAESSSARLQASQIKYLGHFEPPADQGGGKAGKWNYGMGGLTLIPDCMGRQDPTPDDGFPGCMGAFGHVNHYQFGVFDIVPPGSRATQVVPFYEIGHPVVDRTVGKKLSQYYDVLYDKGPSHCRIWWTFGTYYARIKNDPPFLGFSDCSDTRPNPQGLWDFGQEGSFNLQDDPFHTAKMYQGLSLIPQDMARRLFDDKSMMLGISRRSGTRGGSQGPSLYVRHLAVPTVTAPGPVLDAQPLLWYKLKGFINWHARPELSGPAATAWPKTKAGGAEFISHNGREAVVIPWQEPTVNPDDYPCSDPQAYRDADPETPEPCKVPVCWYGVPSCRSGPAKQQQPSFWESKSDGSGMPVDCKISNPCGGGTGPHCLSVRPFLILYDVNDLAAVYRGDKEHNEPQPYAKIPLQDIWLGGKRCGYETAGTTYDPVRQRLYVSQGRAYSTVHVFEISHQAGQ